MKKAIIVGASSGIGHSLSTVLASQGYTLGLAGRRLDLLNELAERLPGKTHVKVADLSDPSPAMAVLADLVEEMGGIDVAVISSGVAFHNPDLSWDNEHATVMVNVAGFTAAANVFFDHFWGKGSGHLVGISSFRAVRGGWSSTAYNASKAYVSNYLEGLRIKANRERKEITVTDVRPGLVATSMIHKKEGPLVASVEKAALQIGKAIELKRGMVYVTKRYRLVTCLLRLMPFPLYQRM